MKELVSTYYGEKFLEQKNVSLFIPLGFWRVALQLSNEVWE